MHMDGFMIIAIEKELKAVLLENDGHGLRMATIEGFSILFPENDEHERWRVSDIAHCGSRPVSLRVSISSYSTTIRSLVVQLNLLNK